MQISFFKVISKLRWEEVLHYKQFQTAPKAFATITLFALSLFSCNHREKTKSLFPDPTARQIIDQTIKKDSVLEPKVIIAGNPKVVTAGHPKIIFTNTNVHPIGTPKVVSAGIPKVCIPGKDSFLLPKIVPAINNPFLAGIPDVVTAKEAYTKDQNSQNFSSFGKLQGLKHSQITSLLEDKNGNLWFSTLGGVGKYDGKNFTHFTDKQGLSQNDVYSMLEDKKGNLWFGTSGGGVSKFDGKSFTHFTAKEGLSNNFVRSILEDKSGNLWFGTEGGGVNKYDGKSFTQFTVKEGLSNNIVLSIMQDKNDNLWFGTRSGGVNKYDGKSFTQFTVKEGLSNNVVYSMLEDKKGNIWFGTGGGGVNKFDGKHFTQFTEKEGLSNNFVRSILEDNNGNLWFGTYGGGVCKYNFDTSSTFNSSYKSMTGSFTHFTEKEGLSNNAVLSILQDNSGNLWFGTFGGGLDKYDGRRFIHFTEKEGLSNNIVLSIEEDKKGNLWFGTQGGGVNKYNNKSFTPFTTNEGLSNNFVWSILEDRKGNLWFGTQGGGVNKYDGKSFTQYTIKEGLCNNFVLSIEEDKKGNLWFGTAEGVSKYNPASDPMEKDSFTNYAEKEGFRSNMVSAILEDKKGNIWFGMRGGGVSKYNPSNNKSGNNGFIYFTEKEGLANNTVSGILEDDYGNIWFGTNNGVSEYDGFRFTNFSEKDGLSNNVVLSLHEDKRGNIWFGTLSGISLIEKEKLSTLSGTIKSYSSSDTNTLYKNGNETGNSTINHSGLIFKTFTYEDGFSGIGVNPGKTIREAKDGTIWIGTNDRLTAMFYDHATPDTSAPHIQLIGLSVFNENVPWQNWVSPSGNQSKSEKKDSVIVLGNGVNLHDFRFKETSKWYGIPEELSLAYNNNYLTFHFVGISIQSPGKVKSQYKLDGLDKNWSTLSFTNEAHYSNLSPGEYTFKAKSMNGDGYWSQELAYTFTIRPPWWLTWWAFIIYIILFALVIWSIQRYQKQHIIQLEQVKAQKKELELAKEIEKAYTHLKSTQAQLIQSEKMASLGELTAGIAHEIQNPLNFVNNFSSINAELIDEMKVEIERGNIEEVKTLANDIFDNEQKIIHHGQRAESIVKNMLQHSRKSTNTKELTNINALADEYMRLSFHGLRAKDKSFHATYTMKLDPHLPLVNVIPQDIERVILNLFNNAFWTVNEKSKLKRDFFEGIPFGESPLYLTDYQPTVTLSTRNLKDRIEIRISDNGSGIPQNIIDKIFQPFFTTKPTGQGTGLGLSLSYDIIKAHGGEIKVISHYLPDGETIPKHSFFNATEALKLDSETSIGSIFIIELPA
ncbi:MAG: two-component regulator propeller domain-containing protein [Saprospiraceae bacterium]